MIASGQILPDRTTTSLENMALLKGRILPGERRITEPEMPLTNRNAHQKRSAASERRRKEGHGNQQRASLFLSPLSSVSSCSQTRLLPLEATLNRSPLAPGHSLEGSCVLFPPHALRASQPLTPLTAHGRSARCDSLVDKKKEGRKRRWRSCCARGAVLRARGIGVVGAGVLTATRVARSGAGRTIRRCART